MCPACLAAAAWIAAAAVSTGGMTALVLKKVATGRAAQGKSGSAIHSSENIHPEEDHHG